METQDETDETLDIMRLPWYSLPMKTQEISAEKLLVEMEEKDRRIAELENQVGWIMSQMKLLKSKHFGG